MQINVTQSGLGELIGWQVQPGADRGDVKLFFSGGDLKNFFAAGKIFSPVVASPKNSKAFLEKVF